jgi:uroporphyrinogen decarboxylase
MTSKERILCAMRGGTPDRVPVQLGIMTIAPRMAKDPGWEVYYHGKHNLYEMMVQMVDEFGFDGYLYSGVGGKADPRDQRKWSREVIRQDAELIVVRDSCETPEGTLWQEISYPPLDPPTPTRGWIKTVEDFKLYLKYFHFDSYDFDPEPLQRHKALLGDKGAVAATVAMPGLHSMIGMFDDKLEGATYFVMDHPDLMEEFVAEQERYFLARLAASLEAKPDYIEFGNSGMLTLSTEEWVRKYTLPTLKKATRMCKEAGIPSELHCCGKERLIVEMCANETDLSSINPLQPPPMGDCDLAEIKRTFGKRLCLKGNVGVTEPMLTGTPGEVEKDVIRCLEAAKEGGGYILFTEEGLGRETPFENIRRYIQVGKALGKY